MTTLAAARGYYARHRARVWTGGVALVAVGFAIAFLVAPEMVWDRFIWQDIYGPLWADAHQCGNTLTCKPPGPNPGGIGAREGYTITSELTYGLILAAALTLIYTGIFRRYGIVTDGWWVAALAPFILFGPLWRVLEDADVFIAPGGEPVPFAYGFISPVIYIHDAVYTVAFLLVGVLVARSTAARADWRVQTAAVGAILAAMTLIYAFVGRAYGHAFGAFAPVWVFAAGAVAGLAFFAHVAHRGRAGVNVTLFSLGLPLPVPAMWLIGRWIVAGPWSERAFNGALQPEAGVAILAMAVLGTGIVALAALAVRRLAQAERTRALAGMYLVGLNLALVFAHLVDGLATWVALMDPFGMGLPSYGEKHPVSDWLLGFGAGTPLAGLGFPLAKITMILLVIWLLDREFLPAKRTDGAAGDGAGAAKAAEPAGVDLQLAGLMKMAIFVLGFGPGVRDLARVVMGV